MIEHYIEYIDRKLEKFSASSTLPLEKKRQGLSDIRWFLLQTFEPEALAYIGDKYGDKDELRSKLERDFEEARGKILAACSSSSARSLMKEFIDVYTPTYDKWDIDEIAGSNEVILNLYYRLTAKQVENIYRKYFGDAEVAW